MAKLDVELQALLSTRDFFAKNPAAGRLHLQPEDELLISVKFSGSIAALEQAGFKVGSHGRVVAHGSTNLAGLEALANLPQVESIQLQKDPHKALNKSVPSIKADKVWGRTGDNFSGYTGRGVIVGIVDTGIDLMHQNFRKADGSTRVVAIWDQTLTAGTGEAPPGPITNTNIAPTTSPTPLGYGVEYAVYKQINDTVQKLNTPGSNLLLEAPDFPSGKLDWYSFSMETADATKTSAANPATITPVNFAFLPNHIVFRGMHDFRWWTFEDNVSDFSQLDTQHVDLAKLLVTEFALVYANDWFAVPVPTPINSLARVTTLVVSDTFGVRTLIRPSEQTTVVPGETPWSMYKLSGAGTRSDFIMMAPTLGVVDDAPPLENVQFLRDDMAAMAWAVEHQLQGEMDTAIDGNEAYQQRLASNPPPPPPTATANGPTDYYTLEIPVPDNWIPMVPVQTAQGALYLRRGTMTVPTTDGVLDITARALILEPGQPFFVADHVIPRAGFEADRYFRRTRASDGTTYLWMARITGPGTGMGWSGLRYDAVRDMASAPSQ
jgi:hypothetical protein